jgi:hypothetical protein
MIKDRIIKLGLPCALLMSAAVAVAPATSSATTPPVRYAAPGGSAAGDCAVAAPCEIAHAIHDAPTGSEVIIEPGNYGSVGTPLNENLSDGGGRLNIHGEVGHPNPVIYETGDIPITLSGSSLSDVTVISYGPAALNLSGGTATRVHASDSADGAGTCELSPYGTTVNPTLTDSVGVATGTDGVAVEDAATFSFNEGRTHATVENVTAEATGPGGLGLDDSAAVNGAGSTVDLYVQATNDIFYGTRYGLLAEANDDGAAATVILRHSAANSWRALGRSNAEVDTETPGDSHATPLFVDAAHQNYAERAGSPTIDKGVPIEGAPTNDILGNPRIVHGAPDLGAYEHLVGPALSHLKLTKSTSSSLRAKVRVNGEGIAAHLTLSVYRNGRFVQAVKNPHAIVHAATAHFVVHFLKPGTSYQIRARATSIGGTTRTKTLTASTDS